MAGDCPAVHGIGSQAACRNNALLWGDYECTRRHRCHILMGYNQRHMHPLLRGVATSKLSGLGGNRLTPVSRSCIHISHLYIDSSQCSGTAETTNQDHLVAKSTIKFTVLQELGIS